MKAVGCWRFLANETPNSLQVTVIKGLRPRLQIRSISGLCSFGRAPQEEQKSLSDFPSDIVTRYAAALGVIAASAGYWSPVFAGAE